MDEAVKV